MKYIILTISAISIVLVSIFSIVTINTQATRENELQNALESSIEEALCARNSYKELNDEKLKEDFTKRFLSKIEAGDLANDKNLSIQFDFLAVDAKKGLLSVDVKEKYSTFFGRTKEISSSATAVVDSQLTAL